MWCVQSTRSDDVRSRPYSAISRRARAAAPATRDASSAAASSRRSGAAGGHVTSAVLEETGVRFEAEALTGVYENMKRGIVSLVFRCRPTAGEPRPTDEAVAFRSGRYIMPAPARIRSAPVSRAVRHGQPALAGCRAPLGEARQWLAYGVIAQP
ncbi:NUDIX hydrolase [Actinoallomurus sp. CA-142502]|uniref:NUDIX hydrolase n=1 Tax=Actinoallomurus sp. CA-142502 TaxID=3239885 RepID=UPI003D8FD8A8